MAIASAPVVELHAYALPEGTDEHREASPLDRPVIVSCVADVSGEEHQRPDGLVPLIPPAEREKLDAVDPKAKPAPEKK